MFIICNDNNEIFAGLYPPQYKPKFMKNEGTFTATIFTNHKDAEEVINSFETFKTATIMELRLAK